MADKLAGRVEPVRRTKTWVAANPNGNRAERRAAARRSLKTKMQERTEDAT